MVMTGLHVPFAFAKVTDRGGWSVSRCSVMPLLYIQTWNSIMNSTHLSTMIHIQYSVQFRENIGVICYFLAPVRTSLVCASLSL